MSANMRLVPMPDSSHLHCPTLSPKWLLSRPPRVSMELNLIVNAYLSFFLTISSILPRNYFLFWEFFFHFASWISYSPDFLLSDCSPLLSLLIIPPYSYSCSRPSYLYLFSFYILIPLVIFL